MGEDENLDEIEETEGDEKPAAPKKKFTVSPFLIKILTGLLAVLVVGLVAGVIAYAVARSVAKSGAIAAGITDDMVKSEPPNFYSLGEFNENTSDLDVLRFVRMKVTVTYTSNVKKLAAELPERIIILRDRVGGIISSYSYDTLRTAEGKKSLKENIKREINNQLKYGEIDEVLFDDFLLN